MFEDKQKDRKQRQLFPIFLCNENYLFFQTVFPITDGPHIGNIGIAHAYESFGGNFAAAAGAAVNDDSRVFVSQ